MHKVTRLDRSLLLFPFLLFAAWVWAADIPLDLSLTEADYGPAIIIEDRSNHRIEEYSVNGNTYMLKVTPAYGSPYFLVDPDGSGDMEWKRNAPGLEISPPLWSLGSW